MPISDLVAAALKQVAAGLHMQWSYCSAPFKVKLESHIREFTPGATVFFDADGQSWQEALRLARLYPLTTFIYRKYLQGDHQYLYMTPAQMLAEHIHLQGAPANFFIQLDNESPVIASAKWMLATMKLFRASGLRAAVGGYGVGQPEEADLKHPDVSALIVYMAQHPGWFVLNLHEYTEGSVFVDWAAGALHPSTWPTAAPADPSKLHLMGRWRRWKKRAAELNVASPKIIIGEWGFDYIQAVPNHMYGPIGSILSSLPTWRGWSNLHPEIYAARMLQHIFRLLYDDPDIIGVVIFCISDHPTDWAEWNVNYTPLFLSEVSKGFNRMTTPPKPQTVSNPHTAGKNIVKLAAGVNYVNRRKTPNGIDAGDVHNNDIVTVSANPDGSAKAMQLGGSFYWYEVTHDGEVGWIAHTSSIDLEPVTSITIPEYIAQQRALLDQMEAAYNRGEL